MREQNGTFYTSKRGLSHTQAEFLPSSFQPSCVALQQTDVQALTYYGWAIYFDNRPEDEYDRLEGNFHTGGVALAFDGGWNDVLTFAISIRNHISAERNLVFINGDSCYDLPAGYTEQLLEEAVVNSTTKEWE